MKEKMIAVLVFSILLLPGCGSGVSQDDYDSLESSYEKLSEEYSELLEESEAAQPSAEESTETAVESVESVESVEPTTDLLLSDLPAQDNLASLLDNSLAEIGATNIGEPSLLSYDEESDSIMVKMCNADISVMCDDMSLIVSCYYVEKLDEWNLSEITNAENGHTYWCIDTISGLYDLYSFPDDELVSAKDSSLTSDQITDEIMDSYENEMDAASESFENSLDDLAEKYGIERN